MLELQNHIGIFLIPLNCQLFIFYSAFYRSILQETVPLEPVDEMKTINQRSSPVIETITSVKETQSAQTTVRTALCVSNRF